MEQLRVGCRSGTEAPACRTLTRTRTPCPPPQVLPLIAVCMPLDAAASVMDGVLFGSQEAAWMGKTMLVTSAVCSLGLLACQRMAWPITVVWCVIKVSPGAAAGAVSLLFLLLLLLPLLRCIMLHEGPHKHARVPS